MAIMGSVAGLLIMNQAYNYQKDLRAQKEAEDKANELKKERTQQFAAEQAQIAAENQRQDQLKAQQEQARYGEETKLLSQSRQRKLATQGQSFADTVLTGPLGVPGQDLSQPALPRKTLLGQ